MVRKVLSDVLPAVERERLEKTQPQHQLRAGTILLHEDQAGDRAFLIVEGELEVLKALGTEEERLLDVAGPGEIVGEMSLLNPGQPRAASVRARTDTTVLELDPVDFDQLMRRNPLLFYEMTRELSRRLRDSDNATIRDLRAKNDALRRAYNDLKAAQAQIVEKEKLERELALAREIQRSILPRSLPSMPGFDFGVRIEPAYAVGGDFYDFIRLSGRRLGIVVGDVAGKGVPSALVMAMTRSLLRPEAGHGRSPLQACKAINRYLLEINDSGLFITLLYGILDPTSRQFTYVRAGHELPIVVDAEGRIVALPQIIGQPLGILDAPILAEQCIDLPPGGLLLLHSDGATDTLDATNTRYGIERLHASVAALAGVDAQGVCDRLVNTLDAYRGATPQADDLTLLTARVE